MSPVATRGTVSAAYDQLVTEGYLITRRGSGTRVADVPLPPAGPAAPHGRLADAAAVVLTPANQYLTGGSPLGPQDTRGASSQLWSEGLKLTV